MQARIETTKKAASKWHEPLPNLPFLAELEKAVRGENDRLSKIDLTKMDSALVAAQRAKQEIDSGDLVAAQASLDEAQKLWSQHVLLASLKESLKKAQAEAAAQAEAEEKPSGS